MRALVVMIAGAFLLGLPANARLPENEFSDVWGGFHNAFTIGNPPRESSPDASYFSSSPSPASAQRDRADPAVC
jgi:hypothetical protein